MQTRVHPCEEECGRAWWRSSLDDHLARTHFPGALREEAPIGDVRGEGKGAEHCSGRRSLAWRRSFDSESGNVL